MGLSKISGAKNLILTGCNDDPKYLKMRRRLLRSIEVNCPGQEVASLTWPGATREESACKRAAMFLRALELGVERVAWLDVDTLVRGCLDEFWGLVGSHALVVSYRPDHDDHFKFNTGVMAVGNSKWMSCLVSVWAHALTKNQDWTADQYWLWWAFQQLGDLVRLKGLPVRYNDSHFAKDSIIWHGKGHSRKSKVWKRESKKYA